ncbi:MULTISPECIES: hypothetical protein [unclassified Janthinobacterium]|uniref:hypothetical protein n=1 Tax=unclassified Janthinobacterium TaxID=2610881 RepID=UPI0017973808|nr:MULTISPECIES: hypothetical protein [unclassified Janthinobacterium]MBB5367017.1 hypothetical protein [Janthinobacterium sp. K2C7]MBB5380505.1 hypothetical protein [Janthinobacterium sp. K2Li3]MBB5385399.1 hypothetical protein [Janthinobacterium sp. K2E3]
MRALIYLLLLLPILGAQAAARTPFQIRCEDTISKTVSVLTAQQNGYSIDTHLPYKALTVMKGVARANTWVLGLTKTDSQVKIALAGPMLQDPVSGYECVAPQIAVSLSYAPVMIYIGREFAPGTCAYDEILAHELRHMKTYMEHLPRVEKIVRAALAKRFEARPLYAPGGTAKAALAREIDTGWLPYIKAEMRKVEVLQAAIDSPQEYARLSKACNGEIQNILAGKVPPPK